MRSRSWGLAGGCALALLTVVALVAWRAPAASPGWQTALAVTALVAVVALLVAAGITGVQALSAERPHEVSVSVPRGGGAPVAAVAEPDGPRRAAVLALVLALAGATPVLVVLVLASTVGDAGASTAAAPSAASGPTTTAPTTTAPTSDGPGVTGPVQPSAGEPPSTQPSTSSPGSSSSPDAAGTSSTSPPGPGGPGAAPPPDPPDAPAAAGCTAVVARGDTLWGLATSRLAASGAAPDDDRLAAETARLYGANAGVVGPDPNLLRPGQRLDLCPCGRARCRCRCRCLR